MRILALVAVLGLCGCASSYTWERPDGSAANLRVDDGQCRAQAYSISQPTPFQRIYAYEACMQGKGWEKARS